MKSMKLNEYFMVIKPNYVYLKLIPDTSIRNYNSSNIAKAISHMYKNIFQSIRREEKQFVFETQVKCSYFIDIRKTSCDFYFIVPIQYVSIAKEKIRETWQKVTIEEVAEIEQFSNNALKYALSYKKEDALSLNVDRKSNEPLNSILNVIDIMQDKDRIGIFYNFMPCSQMPWGKYYNQTITKVKNKLPIDREKFSATYILKMGVTYLFEFIDTILEVVNDFLGADKKDTSKIDFIEAAATALNNNINLSPATLKKKDSIVLGTQLMIASESLDKTRQSNNVLAVCQGFKAIEEDNELVYKKVKNVWNLNDFKISKLEENKMSINECSNLIQLPGRDLLQQHKIINRVDTLETQVPKELQTGVMCIGNNNYRGNLQKSYLSNDKEFKNLTLCLIAPTRAGKTTLISNLSNDGIKAGECTILFDFCGNCELSNDVSKVTKNVLNIDCSNFDTLQGLGYNEIIPSINIPFEVYRCAKTKTMQLMTFINCLSSDEELKARMERYLEAAALVVFLCDGSIKEVFDTLQDHKIRHKFLDMVVKENTDDYRLALEELDEWSKATKDCPEEVIGTKLSYIQGILNRVSKLKQNTYMELMLKKDTKYNINLVNEMQKSQLICIRMPEIMFSTEQEKDIYCTYWITKIWGALQVRKWNVQDADKRIKVNIVFDELYQVPSCQQFLKTKLSQIAKFSAKPIISCHYLGQINNIRNELKSANSSYLLISGCDKDNFKELKEELYPYELEDLLNLKRHESLNLIKYEGGWSKFITKLPPPLK